MNASKIDTGSLCMTCLSQGRKMFPFPLNYTKLPFSTFYRDLKLSANDMICWECKSFILKMAAFRLKALKAQAKLATLGRKPWTTLQSLSNLAISKGIYLVVNSPSQPDPLAFDEVKSEIDMEPDENNELPKENNDKDFKIEMDDIDDENNEIHDVKVEMDDVNDEIGDLSKEEVIFEVYQHKTRVAPVSNNQKEADVSNYVGNIASATLMSLLARKSTQLFFPPLPNETTPINPMSKDIKTGTDIENPTNIPAQQKPETPKNSQNITNIFTEERLTEEQMRKWWESKRENEFFAKSIPVFRCEKCVEPFFTRRSFLGHEKIHTEKYGELSCDICDLRFSTESARSAHRGNHYRLLKCSYCSHKWDVPNSMRRHCYTEHRVPITEWNCDLCPKQLPTYGRYLNHVKSHCSEPCPDCGKRINTINMRIHMLKHKPGSAKFECAECGRKYRTKDHVKTHILRVHNAKMDEPAFCVDCNRQFRNMKSYEKHMKFATKHVAAELLRYKCEQCARSFTSRVLLRRHVEGKHSDERNYPCQLCPARFRNTTARTRHRRMTHEGYVAPKDNMCDHCGKSFHTKGQLSIHINTHTGARPFVCKLCGADFGHKSALYLHGRYKHKIQKKDSKKDNGS